MNRRGPAPRLSATEALLSCAAAETAVEMAAARMALIENGSGVMAKPDRGLLVSGTGDAGRHLLGATPPRPPDVSLSVWAVYASNSCAMRSSRLQDRLRDQLARPTTTEDQP